MTYCLGWKYKDSIFLLADTAVTKQAQPQTPRSSFGQMHDNVRGEHVEEALLKLIPLGRGLVAAFAGDVYWAGRCLDFIREHSATIEGTANLLKSMQANLGPFEDGREVELIVGNSTDSGYSELLCWNSKTGIDTYDADFYQIGSLVSYHSALTTDLLSTFANGNLDAERMLPILTAIVQSYGVHENLIDMYVGGLIFGVKTSGGLVSWQKDINYVLYDPAFQSPEIVSAVARDNSLVVRSSLTNDTRIFRHSASVHRATSLDQGWVKRVRADLDSGRASCWVFISTIYRVITVIFREDPDKDSKYVKMKNLDSETFNLAVHSELLAMLQQHLVDRGDGSLQFRLNVRND